MKKRRTWTYYRVLDNVSNTLLEPCCSMAKEIIYEKKLTERIEWKKKNQNSFKSGMWIPLAHTLWVWGAHYSDSRWRENRGIPGNRDIIMVQPKKFLRPGMLHLPFIQFKILAALNEVTLPRYFILTIKCTWAHNIILCFMFCY